MSNRWVQWMACLVVAVGLLAAGCGTGEAPGPTASAPAAKPAPPPPPPPPETSLGTLVKVERSEKIGVQALCAGGGILHGDKGAEGYTIIGDNLCAAEEKASAGKAFVVLHFEGSARRSVNEDQDMAVFVASGAGGTMSRVDSHSWLADAAGKKYRKPVVVVKKDKRQVAFEVPSDASGLVWHDRKDLYQLEPQPKAISAPAEQEKKESPAP